MGRIFDDAFVDGVARRRDGDASAARVVVSGAPATAVTACGFSGVVMMLLCDMVFVCLVCVGNVAVCLFLSVPESGACAAEDFGGW